MGAVIFFLVLGLLLLIVGLFLLKSWLFAKSIVKEFKTCNVIVDGKKGKGKDLLFQYVIHKRNAPYYSNIDYGGRLTKVSPNDISVEPNTYKEFIEGKNKVIERRFYEGEDFYISDAGIYLPSSMDSVLYKAYPSLPEFYALSRHISASNIHCNVQNVNRVWKALREQADFFVHVDGHIKLICHILIKCVTYDNVNSAIKGLRPIRRRALNKFSKAETDVYDANNGTIKQGWVILKKKHIKYDTRAFEKVLYGDSPRIEREKKMGLIKRLFTRLRRKRKE